MMPSAEHVGIDVAVQEMKHYLPAQASLKDFIHHNPLHAFQHERFFSGIGRASAIFGYKVTLSLAEYRHRYAQGEIDRSVLRRVIQECKPDQSPDEWVDRLLNGQFSAAPMPRIGLMRAGWKKSYRIDMDARVHPLLFRILCSFLDQGISIWDFPLTHLGFLEGMRELERLSPVSFFKRPRARALLLDTATTLETVLTILVGDAAWHGQYIFDQQFAHPGWSGMVAVIEDAPGTLLDTRTITLRDLILVELLMEIDVLDERFGTDWKPLAAVMPEKPQPLFAPVDPTPLQEAVELWQVAFERAFHDQALAGIAHLRPAPRYEGSATFQALFCIDDRECSLRRYIEDADPDCRTYGTPGFFGVEFYFQPQGGKFLTKLCPAPMTPRHVIVEQDSKLRRKTDPHFRKSTHGLFRGWIISQTLGFWSAVRLFMNVFRPSMSPATASSFRHMDKDAVLSVEHKHPAQVLDGMQVGFTIPEMADRVEGLLKSIGLVDGFGALVYVVGHGSSSVNNPHFAAYDCGACSGRAGSVNARVVSAMANDAGVRTLLRARGIDIPEATRFVGGLHDTTRDEIVFFDERSLSIGLMEKHQRNEAIFRSALDRNAKERSRRFESIDTRRTPEHIHQRILTRSVSLFEPRPELNHATNALCIVGRRSLTDGLFLDRRAFMNSYDHRLDPQGDLLLNILKPIPPVCGGINLEYFFSRTDNRKLGAGSKLPHNVMGLFAVANGADGDLRPGLPSQMIEVHDPIRLLVIVEHFPAVVLDAIRRHADTYDWFLHEWVLLAAVDPVTRGIHRFRNGTFQPYEPVFGSVPEATDLSVLIEESRENIPVHQLTTAI